MKSNPHFLRLAFATIIIAFAGPALLQADQTSSDPGPARFDFSFEGGTARDFLKAIESQTLNFIVPEMADTVKIPPFSVKNVTHVELLSALNLLLEDAHPEFDMAFKQAQRDGIWVLQIQRNPAVVRRDNADIEAKNLERLSKVSKEIEERREQRRERLQTSTPEPEPEPEKYVTLPVNISRHLEHSSIEGISSVIQSAVAAHSALLPESSEKLKIDIKFQRETNILILSGHRKAVELAQDTLLQIYLTPSSKKAPESR
ncbi:hypothetical protein [Pelagicoccus sp. SDUM812003]|uniref:hypothetical protein n=1 Tax=Pelagicoccus sp. SDUM812003 TaxID=3041267 RepID=UPI00280CE1F1|nr:hypothetical protein [Pelagicoccus sp. SDUM812003]MDQ8205312.1 hypothetical protein [Pelagicoccus sp. SDUM812003]